MCLSKEGIHFSLDDYGIGYSNLSRRYLLMSIFVDTFRIVFLKQISYTCL